MNRLTARTPIGVVSRCTVEEGKLADLVLLEAGPLEDIHNTERIAALVADGRYVSRADLSEMLAEVEAASTKP